MSTSSARFEHEIRSPKLDRFMNKVSPEPMSGCWLWIGATDSGGYGTAWIDGKCTGAHRVAYLLLIGEIPAGLELDHKCRTRCCVNPSHLEPVTHRENILRGTNHVAGYVHRDACPDGHEFTPLISSKGVKFRGCRKCMRLYQKNYRDSHVEELREYRRKKAEVRRGRS